MSSVSHLGLGGHVANLVCGQWLGPVVEHPGMVVESLMMEDPEILLCTKDSQSRRGIEKTIMCSFIWLTWKEV